MYTQVTYYKLGDVSPPVTIPDASQSQYRSVANGALGGRIMPPATEPVVKVSETPGPGHYVSKGAAGAEPRPKPVYSAFASQSQRGPLGQLAWWFAGRFLDVFWDNYKRTHKNGFAASEMVMWN